MSRASAFLLLACLALAAMFASWPEGGASSFDCTTITPTPTASPTPTPTPPWGPYAYVPICNDAGQDVSDLHVRLVRPATNPDPVGANAPNCPEPAYSYDGSPSSYTSISIDWGTPCVDPGEMVTLYFFAGCATPAEGCSAPNASCSYWTLDGAPAPAASPAVNPPACANPSPVPTGTPQPTGPCPPRETPPVTYAPTPAPSTPTPTPGPTSRDMIITATIPFCNDAGQSASDLHVRFAFPYSGRTFKANPSGCPEPSFKPLPYGLDTYELDVDWGVACVDPGESLTLQFIYACGDVACITPQPFCYTWTLFGELLYQGPGDCLLPTPTPTPTPPVDVTVWTFSNDTSLAASDLHASYTWPFSARLVENAPGCPESPLVRQGFDSSFDLDWGVPCVDVGESVKVEITSEPPAALRCRYWTLFGEPLTSPSGCLRAGDLNCNGAVDSVDALRVLAIVAGMIITQEACASPDVDCDGDQDAVDALKILRYVVGLAYTQHEPCPDIGLPAD